MRKHRRGPHEPILNADQQRRIREYYEWRRRGKTQVQLAKMFDVTQSTIGKVVNYLPPYDKVRTRKRKAKPP